MQRILQGSHFSATLELRDKDMFIFEFCSLMKLGMDVINKLFHG